MADATEPFDAPQRAGDTVNLPVAAATALYAGVILAINAGGYVVQASDTANLRVIGRSEEDVDNTDGANGDLSVNARRGVFRYGNSATNAVTLAHVDQVCYVEDSVTVDSDGGVNSIKAGRVIAVDDDGVWVDTRDAALL